ncbi:MAG TPA: hypothetical protein VH281_00390 [Gaiellaceae bacterium]|jgi:hypothetical protein
MKNDSTLAHLRRLNPAPEVVSVDGAELYDRITSLPPDERLGARRSPRRRRVVLAAVALAAMAILATTAFALSNWFGDVVEPAVTKQEYKTAQRQLTLPPGATWPSLHVEPNSVTTRGGGGGSAVLIAMNAWECYWADAIRSGDPQAQQQAHVELNGLLQNNVLEAPEGAPEDYVPPNPPSVPYAVFAHDGGLEYIRSMYADAAGGKPHHLIQSCRANAP